MTAAALAGLVGRSIRRARRSFVLSVFGIAVGIASLAFFLALAAGAHRVLDRVFPVGQLEVVPARAALDGPLSLLPLGGPKPLDAAAAKALAALPGVRAVWPRMRLAFPALATGGARLVGRDVRAELIAEGIAPDAVKDESIGPEPFSDALGSEKPCAGDADCAAPEYCAPPLGREPNGARCERPIPAVISPFLLELYNGAIAPSHHLPKLTRFLVSQLRGFTITAELGASMIGAPAGAPVMRKIMLVGVADHAARLALSLPLGVVERWNAALAGGSSGARYSSIDLELAPGADGAGPAAAVRRMGYDLGDQGAERAGLALLFLTLLFTLVSGAIVALAAINIAHGFYRAVAERKREIGVLRAVGASALDVERMVLAEAAAIGLCGGAIGLGLARLGALGSDALAARLLPDFPFKPDSFFAFGWPLIVGALLCAVLACMAGAVWPARAAARLEPSEALAAP